MKIITIQTVLSACFIALTTNDLRSCQQIDPTNATPKILTKSLQITSYEDKTVLLPCQVLNLPPNMHIIWQYSKSGPNSDAYTQQTVLTIGQTQIENNYRLRLINNMTTTALAANSAPITTNNIEIRKLQVTDSGWYECQLPTKPTQKTYVFLQVHGVPKISVSRKHDRIELTCHVSNKPANSSHLFWTFDSHRILPGTTVDNYGFEVGAARRRVVRRNSLNKGYTVLNNEKLNMTRLRISNLSEAHKGVYRCHYDKIETEFHLDYLFTAAEKGHLKNHDEELTYGDEQAGRPGLNKASRLNYRGINLIKLVVTGIFCFLIS